MNHILFTITGFQDHHDAFKAILQRILTLSNIIQSAKDFYQRYLNRITKSITIKHFQKLNLKHKIGNNISNILSIIKRKK